METFENESKILKKLQHNNIPTLIGCYIDKYNYYIATQYCKGGNLLESIKKFSHFSEKQASKYLKTIISAISYCHSLNIVHRDLKPANLVFDEPVLMNDDGSTSQLKIIDFGIAIEIEDSDTNDEYTGTLVYMPPESCGMRTGLELKYGDMWSIGIIAYILVCGDLPFRENTQQKTLVSIMMDDIVWPKDIDLSDNCKDFISRLLEKEPMYRMSADEALKHPWIAMTNQVSHKDLSSVHRSNLSNLSREGKYIPMHESASLYL